MTINATDAVEVIGETAIFRNSEGIALPSAFSTTAFNTGSAGDLTIKTGKLSVRDAAEIAVDTRRAGDAGNLTINATDSIELIGRSEDGLSDNILIANTEGPGNAGEITLMAPQITALSGATIAATTSDGAGGSITITGNTFESSGGGRVVTTTSDSNNAGDINFFLQDRLLLSGTDSAILANTDVDSEGDGGNIFIGSQTVTVQDGAEIGVGSQGRGVGGDITLEAGGLNLSNNAAILAETTSSNGGTIELQIQNLLLLSGNSQISTNAGTSQSNGDGGNIEITTQFLVANPSENNDITANAFEGQGGNVDITAQGIFGITFRDQESPLTSDITASSQFGTEGIVDITTPETDPNSALINLPVQIPETKVTKTCSPGGPQAQNKFITSGRGGVPPTAQETLFIEKVDVPLVNLNPQKNIAQSEKLTTESEKHLSFRDIIPNPRPIVEAQGWETTSDGNIALTAPQSSPKTHLNGQNANC